MKWQLNPCVMSPNLGSKCEWSRAQKKEPPRAGRSLIKPQFSTLLLEHRTWALVLSFRYLCFAKGLKSSSNIDKLIYAFVFKY